MIQEQHIGLIGSTTIKSEIIGNDERTMMHSQNIQQMMHQQSNLHHHNQQMPEGFNITSNNAQPSNNDGMDIYRDLILRHLVQDISTTCSKLYLPTSESSFFYLPLFFSLFYSFLLIFRSIFVDSGSY